MANDAKLNYVYSNPKIIKNYIKPPKNFLYYNEFINNAPQQNKEITVYQQKNLDTRQTRFCNPQKKRKTMSFNI